MLTKIYLRNFRGFSEHELPIAPLTLIVGRNNAGKSTLIEALRLIALATARYRTVPYDDAPEELDLPYNTRGISPSLREFNLDKLNLFHRYGDPPAVIRAEFEEGTISIYLYSPDDVFMVIRNERGQLVQASHQAKTLRFPQINVMPQVSPIAFIEERLNERYVRRSAFTSLSSLHFRNELAFFEDKFPTFKKLCEDNWHRLQIRDLLHECGEKRNEFELHIRDEDFVGEIRWMGHGLQIWLQIMWFLARVEPDATIVLDEPDVYLHADLQRKLIRILKQQNRQSIIATHSIEMMSEVEPSSILVTDRRRRSSGFSTSLPGVQSIIDGIGGVHNIQLARLWSSRRVLFVEGKDTAYLKVLQDKLFPGTHDPIGALPYFSVGGWGGWNYAVGSAMLLKGRGGEGICKYCIFDRDYHPENDIQERYESADRNGVFLHIWNKKEIENYFIIPKAIARYVNKNKRKGKIISKQEVERIIDQLCEDLKDDILDTISEEFVRRNRPSTGGRGGNKYAREVLAKRWSALDGKLGVVGGKDLISKISNWSQSNFGIGLNAAGLCGFLETDEIDEELVKVMKAIELAEPFPRDIRPLA